MKKPKHPNRPRRPLQRANRGWLYSGALQMLCEEADDILFHYRLLPERKMEYISAAAQAALGYTPEDFYQDPDLLPMILIPRDREKLEQVFSGASTETSLILRFRKRGGHMAWMQIYLHVINRDDGTPLITHGLARDISEKTWTESVMTRFINASQIAISIITQQDGSILTANEGFFRMFGYRSDEILGKSFYQIDIWPSREESERIISLVSLSSYLQNQELHLQTREGHPITVMTSFEAIEYNGQPCVMTITSDITEQNRAREALRHSEARFRRLFEDAVLGIFQSTMQGKIIHANPAFVRMFGYDSLEEILRLENTTRVLYANPADRDRILQMIRQESSGNQAEVEYRRKDGSLFLGRVHTWGVSDHADEGIYLEGFVEDISEKRKVEKAEKEQRVLAEALRVTAEALTSSVDLNQVLDTILIGLGKVIPHEAANIMLVENGIAHMVRWHNYDRYVPEVNRVFKTFVEITRVPNFQRAAETHYPVMVSNTRQSSTWREFGTTAWIHSNITAPIEMENRLIGFINVDSTTPGFFTEEHIRPMQMFAYQAAIAINRAQLYEDLQRSNQDLSRAYEATIEGWAMALELRDADTRIHTRRVTELTCRLAAAINIAGDEIEQIRRGAILHDIGKMGVPDRVMQKEGELSEEEMQEMRKHPLHAFRMLSGINYLQRALDIPYCHHEKWDGTGYPRGLKGEAIPLAARIFALVDVWDALTHDRVYRPAWSREKTLAYFTEQTGKHFDPSLIDIFLKMIAEE